jgi:hypothetical protein
MGGVHLNPITTHASHRQDSRRYSCVNASGGVEGHGRVYDGMDCVGVYGKLCGTHGKLHG